MLHLSIAGTAEMACLMVALITPYWLAMVMLLEVKGMLALLYILGSSSSTKGLVLLLQLVNYLLDSDGVHRVGFNAIGLLFQ
jgi:hypothetical protein